MALTSPTPYLHIKLSISDIKMIQNSVRKRKWHFSAWSTDQVFATTRKSAVLYKNKHMESVAHANLKIENASKIGLDFHVCNIHSGWT